MKMLRVKQLCFSISISTFRSVKLKNNVGAQLSHPTFFCHKERHKQFFFAGSKVFLFANYCCKQILFLLCLFLCCKQFFDVCKFC